MGKRFAEAPNELSLSEFEIVCVTALTKWPYFEKLSVKLLQLIKLLVSWTNFAKL